MKKPCSPKGHGFFIVPSNELVHQEESLSDSSYNVQELSQMALLPVQAQAPSKVVAYPHPLHELSFFLAKCKSALFQKSETERS